MKSPIAFILSALAVTSLVSAAPTTSTANAATLAALEAKVASIASTTDIAPGNCLFISNNPNSQQIYLSVLAAGNPDTTIASVLVNGNPSYYSLTLAGRFDTMIVYPAYYADVSFLYRGLSYHPDCSDIGDGETLCQTQFECPQ